MNKYQRRLPVVDAEQFDGSPEMTERLNICYGPAPGVSAYIMPSGCRLTIGDWVVVSSCAGTQILRDLAFRNMYEPHKDVPGMVEHVCPGQMKAPQYVPTEPTGREVWDAMLLMITEQAQAYRQAAREAGDRRDSGSRDECENKADGIDRVFFVLCQSEIAKRLGTNL